MGLILPEDAGTLVRWCIAILHVVAGLLILFRRPVLRMASNWEILVCVPAILSSGIVFYLAGPTDQWHYFSRLFFLVFSIWTIGCFAALGKNFAVFPSVRSIVRVGPYSLVRHPAYLGELGLVSACVWTSDWADAGLIVLAAAGFALATIVIRILIEERLLSHSSAYREYRRDIRWRLVPWIW